jgi:lipoyl(octanoyl) transferase
LSQQKIQFEDLGVMDYQSAWDYQESLLQQNVLRKSNNARNDGVLKPDETVHHLLFVEHPPVYTLGKSGSMDHVLIGEEERNRKSIQFYKTNRGGDITFHGPGQLVGYPILDLEKFYTDIGKYLRNIEEVIIRTMAEYDLVGERSAGETGVWIEPGVKGRERKICAIGVRCSRWITMHGFAFNINTDLNYFDYIIPCGIKGKDVTSLERELGRKVDEEEVKQKVRENFEEVFNVKLFSNSPVIEQ